MFSSNENELVFTKLCNNGCKGNKLLELKLAGKTASLNSGSTADADAANMALTAIIDATDSPMILVRFMDIDPCLPVLVGCTGPAAPASP